MSRLSLTMKSLLAMGAATVLTITASADEPKPKPEITEDAKAMVAGSGAGKASFKDLSITAKGGDDDEIEYQGGDIESEGEIALNTIAAPDDKLGPIKGESQDRAVQSGCEPYPACARNKEELEEEVAAPIKFDGVEGEAKDRVKAAISGGEDRLTENVSIASGPNGMMPEAKKDAAEKIGGNDPIPGVDIITKRPPEDK